MTSMFYICKFHRFTVNSWYWQQWFPKSLVLPVKQIHKMRQESPIIFLARLFYCGNHGKNKDSLKYKSQNSSWKQYKLYEKEIFAYKSKEAIRLTSCYIIKNYFITEATVCILASIITFSKIWHGQYEKKIY